jgi:hypothetical protein
MNKKIEEKYNMFTNVNEVFDANAATIETVPALSAQVGSFKTGYSQLDGMMQPLLLDPKGNAKAKALAKKDLSRIGGIVCAAIRSFANDQNDPVLFAKADYSPSALVEGRDVETQQTGQALYNLANGLAAELKSYGIGSTELDSLKAAADKFALLNPLVRKVKVDNKTLLAQLKANIKELNDLLRSKLDNSMMVMEFTKPELLQLYRNARRNYTLGVRHEQPEAKDGTNNTVSKAIAAPVEPASLSAALQDMGMMSGNGVGV